MVQVGKWLRWLLTESVMLFLVLVQWILLTSVALARDVDIAETPGGAAYGDPAGRSFPWLAIGPFLFLQLEIFQNIARLSTVTDWPLPMAFGWILLAQLIGLAAAAWVVSKRRRTLWPLALISSIGLVVILALQYTQSAVLTAVLLLVGQVLLSLLIVLVFIGLGEGAHKARSSRITVANGLGTILFILIWVVDWINHV